MRRRRRSGSATHQAHADFERLLLPHLDHLYKLAYRFTGSSDRAEDLIQDLLVRIYPRGAELARIEQPRPWLVRVMYRIFIDQKRRDKRSPYVAIADTDIGDVGGGDPYGGVVDTAPGPETELELKFDREELLRAWDQLSDEHKALLALFEIEGYSLNELQSLLDVTIGTLKSRLHRARARLAQLLAAEPLAAAERVRSKSEA